MTCPLLLAVALLLVSTLAAAESFTGKVVNVSDGDDTITVLDSENNLDGAQHMVW